MEYIDLRQWLYHGAEGRRVDLLPALNGDISRNPLFSFELRSDKET
jgi:hypothetical protein